MNRRSRLKQRLLNQSRKRIHFQGFHHPSLEAFNGNGSHDGIVRTKLWPGNVKLPSDFLNGGSQSFPESSVRGNSTTDAKPSQARCFEC